MRKRWLFTTIGAVAGGALAYILKDEDKRNRLTEKAKDLQNRFSSKDDLPVTEAGNPELSGLENSKMVSEGSQFGVQYYNELTEKEREILEKSNS